MGLLEFFTNNEKTKNGEAEVKAPAFSATKVQASLGVVLVGILAVVPATLKDDEQVVIAALAAATAIMLGVFALIAVDIRTRQRAKEASLRYGGDGAKGSPPSFQALPIEDLVLQKGHNADEYEVKLAMVEEGSVRVVAARDGELVSATFKEAPKPK